MRTPTVFAWVALAALSWGGGPARADDDSTRQELQRIYDQVTEGVKKKEPAPGEAFVAAEFKERDVFGKTLTAEQVRARLKESLEKTESITSLKATVLRVYTRENLALALVRTTAAATIRGKDGKPHQLDSQGWSLHLWQKEGDGWKIRFADQLAMRQRMDGKLMRPPGGRRMRRLGPARPKSRQAFAEPAAWIPVAQWYSTPYNYGWGGYGSYYGYGWGMGAKDPTGYSSNLTSIMMARQGSQMNIYRQQRQYEAYMKQQKKYEKQLAALRKQQEEQMKQYLQTYQQTGQVPGAAAGAGGGR